MHHPRQAAPETEAACLFSASFKCSGKLRTPSSPIQPGMPQVPVSPRKLFQTALP